MIDLPGQQTAAEVKNPVAIVEDASSKVQQEKHPDMTPKFKISADASIFIGTKGGVNPVANAGLSYGNAFRLATQFDSGYLGDLAERRDMRKMFLETHGYLFPVPNLPVGVTGEFYNFTHERDVSRAGVAAGPLKYRGAEMSADFMVSLPNSEEADKKFGDGELWTRGKVSLDKNTSFYGTAKHFFRNGNNDTTFGKIGVQRRFGKDGKNYLNVEYRDWPTARVGPYHGERHRSVYVGFGRRII